MSEQQETCMKGEGFHHSRHLTHSAPEKCISPVKINLLVSHSICYHLTNQMEQFPLMFGPVLAGVMG
jgi:hypothetical protein